MNVRPNASIDKNILIGGIIAIGVVLLIALVVFLVVWKKKKETPKVIINQEFVQKLISYLGMKANIEKIGVDNQKLIVNVINLDIVNLEGIKEMANSGVFVTGNTIKTLFKYDSNILKNEIDKLGE